MYKFGTIVLIPFPFTDLSSTKLRPALIISRTSGKEEDVIVAFITTKTEHRKRLSDFSLKSSDAHFQDTGLKMNSVVRFDKIATLNKKLILGELGYVHPALLRKMKSSFGAAFGFNA
ncbi:type II toxin-antitoxin system PemK/MazF family toxin [Candidatus Peregrinibacteria bacterium]|nr:type II toxin-antitoxin system PemK/MazF family toxin [Candidatus Peregrinibacteria bacterium]